MSKNTMIMIVVMIAALSCLISLGVSLWYYVSSLPSKEKDPVETTEEDDVSPKSSLLDSRPAFTLKIVNGDTETQEVVVPDSSAETVTVSTGAEETPGSSAAGSTTPLVCEEGQVASNGECVPVTPPVSS